MDNFLSEGKKNLENVSNYSRVHVVLGNESCDLDSAVSAVTYAFYLHTKYQREVTPDVPARETTLTVPVLNIRENQYRLRTETTHFFQKHNIQASHLIFKDQIDIESVYNDDRLVITLVDHNILTGEFVRYEDKVIEVIDHRPQERENDDRVRVKLDLVGSCCTLVAEELLDDPDFHLDTTIAELLYGTILVDTINRSPDAGKITPRDEKVLLRLEESLPGVEGEKLFNELQAAKFDISGLLNMEILEKDLKRVAGTAMTIAMSSVTMDMQEFINRPNFKEDLVKFCVQERCEVVVIMTLVNDDDGKPTRQIAVYSENRIFRDQIADTLDNSIDIDLDLEMVTPPFDEISVFEQGNVKASRKKVLPILKSFLVGDTTPDVASKDFVSVHTVSVPTDGTASVIEVPDTPEVHFTLDSIDELSGLNSFENNTEQEVDQQEVSKQEVNTQEVDLLGLNSLDVSNVNNSNTKILDFDPLATISSLDEESPPNDIPDDTFFGNTQNPFSDHGNTNTNKFTQNAKETSATFSSANLSSAHSSNVFDLGISDSELVDPFSSVDETGSQVYPESSPKDIKLSESGENETKDADIENNNPFNIEVTMNSEEAQSLNPFQDISEVANGNLVNFQLNDEDDEVIKGDNSNYIMPSKTNPFSSGTFLEVDAYKSEHLLAYKSPSLIVECDEKSQADDLADLEESELFDKIPTPEIEHSGESSPFVMSETGTPYEAQGEYHPRTASEFSTLGMTVPPNSLMDIGFEDMDRRLPSFNNAEMVDRINRKKALLGDLISTEEIVEENSDVNIPYTPANSFRDNSFENIMRENSLPSLLNDSEMLEKVRQKRDSLQANIDFTESSDTQTNPFESNPFGSSNFEENSSSVQGTTLTSNGNPFFQLDNNTSGGIFGNQSERGVTSLEQTDSSDVFNIFGDTGVSTNTSLDNQVGSKTGSLDLCDISDFVTQSTQSGTLFDTQSVNPFTAADDDLFSLNDSASNTSHQTVSQTFNSKSDSDEANSENQSIIDAINNSANLEAVDAVSESLAREILHTAIETYPDLKNPAVAEGVFSNVEQDGVPFWTQQGSGDSGIGSTDSPQQVPKGKLQSSHPLHSEISVETEYLPGMDPLHGSLNIVTSPSQSHSIETDAGKEVVEGESFRKVSEAFLPEASSSIFNQTSPTIQSEVPELPEQIREMIINKNIDTTAENIQSSTSVNRVVSPDDDKVTSLDEIDTDLTDYTETGAPLIAIPNDDASNSRVETADYIENDLDVSKKSSKTEISNGAVDSVSSEAPVVDLLGAVDNVNTEAPVVDLFGAVDNMNTEADLLGAIDNVNIEAPPVDLLGADDIVIGQEVPVVDLLGAEDNVNTESPVVDLLGAVDNENTEAPAVDLLGAVDNENTEAPVVDFLGAEDNENTESPVVDILGAIDNVNTEAPVVDLLGAVNNVNTESPVVDLLGAEDNENTESPVVDLLGDFLESSPVNVEMVDTQDEFKISNVSMDGNKDIINDNENNEMNSDSANYTEAGALNNLANYTETGAPQIAIPNDEEAPVASTIMSSFSDNSISSDASSSYQSSSESELVTVRENTEKPVGVHRVVFNDQQDETHSETDNLENDVGKDTNEVLISKEDEASFFEVADKLVKETFREVLEQEKSRIIKGGETEAAGYYGNDVTEEENMDTHHKGDERMEEKLETSDNAGIEMPEMGDDLSDVDNVDKQFIVDKSDIVADQTPVLINSMMTESGLTMDSVSPVETPSEEHASGFYEVNAEKGIESSLNDSSYRTNLGENETGFYDFTNNEAEDADGGIDLSKDLVGMNIRSYEDNALKLDTVINNEKNTNFLMLDEDYSDASVSPLETPETEHAQGFYDINADNLELAIAKSESLNVSSLMADSTYSDSSMSPLDTPDTETVGGFYDFSAEAMQNTSENSIDAIDDSVVAKEDSEVARKQLGPDDAPEINIVLAESPESSKDSFDSETESCFEEKEDMKQAVTVDNESTVTTKNRSVRFAESTKFPEEMVKSNETVESQESDTEGIYELNAELEGDLLQNIDVGNPFSPIESPNEEVFAMNYEINPCLPDPIVQNTDNEHNDKIAESLLDDKVEEMADFLVETALNEAISALNDENLMSVTKQQEKEGSFVDNMTGLKNSAEVQNDAEIENNVDLKQNVDITKDMDPKENLDLDNNAELKDIVELENHTEFEENSDNENNVDEIENDELCVAKDEASLYNVADQLVEEAMTSAVEIVQDMSQDQEPDTFRDPMTEDVSREVSRVSDPISDSESDDSDNSSTTTEGSYRIDHSSDLLTPDRDGVIGTDIDLPSGVIDVNNAATNIVTSDLVLIADTDVDKEVNNVATNIVIQDKDEVTDTANDEFNNEQNIEAAVDTMTFMETDVTAVPDDSNNNGQISEAPVEDSSIIEQNMDKPVVQDFDNVASNIVAPVENFNNFESNIEVAVNDVNTVDQNVIEKLIEVPDYDANIDLIGNDPRQVEVVENLEQQTEYVELFAEENKENVNVETEKYLEEVNEKQEKQEFKLPLRDASGDNIENEVLFNLNDENGNVADEILKHDYSLDFDEEDTSRFDEDTNTSIDVKSPDGPSYYKYDSFELDDKDVSEKSKTLNRQGTIIPDIIISMDDSPPILVDETVKCRRLGNYKPEIIDLSHETEDEISEKDESAESDNVSEASVDTQLVSVATEEETKETEEKLAEAQAVTTKMQEVFDKYVEEPFIVSSEIVTDTEKVPDIADQVVKNITESSENVKYHNIKDLESEKQAKFDAKKIKGEKSLEGTVTMVTDKKGQDEYVTRKEIFYTSAGRLSISIDSVVDPPNDSETEADDKIQKPQKPIDDDDDLPIEPTQDPVVEKQHNDQQKISPINQEKMKVMEETEEWHEDPIPGMGGVGVTQESSTEESDTESESEYTKPARPDTLLNGARKKKKIAATNNLLSPDSTDDLVEGVDNIPTPDDLETPSDLDGELEWEDDTPITPVSDTKKFVEYRDDEAEREKYENTKFRKVEIAGKDYRVDMKVIEPYKKVLSHGGYYGDGLNAIILFCGCYLPDRGRRDYQYVMDNLFLYVISTLELLVAEDYMIVYFHGATPRRQMPSFSWLKRCYQMIDRRLRKNLKGLLMVHPTLWLKTVVLMTKPFISSKFSSKLRFVKTLKELGKIVPMDYIYVPEPVSQYDDKLYQHRPCTSTPVTPSSSS